MASPDGMLALRVHVPLPPERWRGSGSTGGLPIGWFWQMRATGEDLWHAGRAVDADTGAIWFLLEGEGLARPITLSAEAELVK